MTLGVGHGLSRQHAVRSRRGKQTKPQLSRRALPNGLVADVCGKIVGCGRCLAFLLLCCDLASSPSSLRSRRCKLARQSIGCLACWLFDGLMYRATVYLLFGGLLRLFSSSGGWSAGWSAGFVSGALYMHAYKPVELATQSVSRQTTSQPTSQSPND